MPNDEFFHENQTSKNKLDPLKHREHSEGARRELFERYSRSSNGFAQRDVAFAAGNLVLNSIRQQCPTSKTAELMFDEFVANMKRSLLDYHYSPSGERRSVFPFDQNIRAGLVDARPKCRRPSG